MTKYEIISVILSIIALVISILIPFIQWIYREKRKAILKFYPTGRVILYTNRSGSYLRLDGVFEALKKPVSLKKLSIVVNREKDDQKLKLEWFKFYSPTTQNLMGIQAQAEELAHPFRIDADHVACAFVEFFEPMGSAEKAIKPKFDKLVDKCRNISINRTDFDSVEKELVSSDAYKEAKKAIEKELFWEIGEYHSVISASFEDHIVEFVVNFNVSESQYIQFVNEIKEILISPLKDRCNVRYIYHPVVTDVK